MRLPGILVGMTPIDTCLQTLKVLIAVGEVHQIVLAEQAIDGLMAANIGSAHKIETLTVLEGKLISARRDATGQSADFADTVFAYIDKLVRNLTTST